MNNFRRYKAIKECEQLAEEEADCFRQMELAKRGLEGFKTFMAIIGTVHLTIEMQKAADLFRCKVMMRRWKRAYLNVCVAKDSFELKTEKLGVPSITDLLTYTKGHDVEGKHNTSIGAKYSSPYKTVGEVSPKVRRQAKSRLDEK